MEYCYGVTPYCHEYSTAKKVTMGRSGLAHCYVTQHRQLSYCSLVRSNHIFAHVTISHELSIQLQDQKAPKFLWPFLASTISDLRVLHFSAAVGPWYHHYPNSAQPRSINS